MKPGSPAWEKRIAELLALEYRQPFGWWWLSFATETRFLGVAIVRAQGVTTALQRSHALGINPGGQVQSVELPAYLEVPEAFLGRLLSREDIDAFEAFVKISQASASAAAVQ